VETEGADGFPFRHPCTYLLDPGHFHDSHSTRHESDSKKMGPEEQASSTDREKDVSHFVAPAYAFAFQLGSSCLFTPPTTFTLLWGRQFL
jgi:hypothetical protein